MARAYPTNNVDFTGFTTGNDAASWKLWNHATTSNAADLIMAGTLTGNPAALTANQFYRIASGSGGLKISLPLAAATTSFGTVEATLIDALQGVLAGTTYLQLYSTAVDAGTLHTGTSIGSRVSMALNAWTIQAGS